MNIRRIKLTRGKWATVDDEFYDELVAMGSWYFNGRYAVRNHNTSKGHRTVYMHKVVMSMAGRYPAKMGDHRNRRTLDNRIDNLRPATKSQNNRNVSLRKNNTSGFKGVIWHRGRWLAQIRVDLKNRHVGYFKSKVKAARAYDQAALRYFGEFASTNFKAAV